MRVHALLCGGISAFALLACTGGGLVEATSGGTSGAAGGVTTGAGAGTGAGTATGAGAGGSGPVCPPTPPVTGSPISAPDGAWTWIPIAGSRCRDGSEAGIGVRLNASSQDVFIYLEGGGACFNGTTCTISATSFGAVEFEGWAGTVGQTGIFNPGNADNPVMGWNAVYVPYCSGDVHAGQAMNVDVPGGPAHQEFTGYENVGLYLQRLLPTFKDAKQVLLTGISAGGFGAAFNYDRVASAFCPTKVTLLDDSGPPMSDAYLAPCLQKKWRGLWDLAATLPADCADCAEANGGGIVNYVPYLASKWPESHLGLISSTHDAIISTFYGFGTANCTQATPIPGDVYAAGLDDLRDNYMSKSGLWGTFFIDSVTHTWLLGPGFYTTSVQGKKLTTWVGDLLAGQAGNIGP